MINLKNKNKKEKGGKEIVESSGMWKRRGKIKRGLTLRCDRKKKEGRVRVGHTQQPTVLFFIMFPPSSSCPLPQASPHFNIHHNPSLSPRPTISPLFIYLTPFSYFHLASFLHDSPLYSSIIHFQPPPPSPKYREFYSLFMHLQSKIYL